MVTNLFKPSERSSVKPYCVDGCLPVVLHEGIISIYCDNSDVFRVKLVNNAAPYNAVKNPLIYEIGSRKKSERRQSAF